MADWKFLKKPEFWIATIIAIILTFVGGFIAGKSYVIYGDYADLNNKYTFLNSSYNKLIIQDSSNNIITQDQQGNNLLINQKEPARKLDDPYKKSIDNILTQYKGKKIFVRYLAGDSEVYNFAHEIINYLVQKGYEVESASAIYAGGKMEGESAFIDSEGTLIFTIGDKL